MNVLLFALLISQTPERVVSLSPAITETMFALGEGARVKGVTRYCDKPAEALLVPKVGSGAEVSIEAIIAIAPDVVIAQPSSGQTGALSQLEKRGIAVRLIKNDTVEESARMMEELGVMFGKADVGRAMAQAQRAAFAPPTTTSTSSTARAVVRAVVLVGTNPLVVAGRGSFGEAALLASGVVPATTARDPPWPQWSLETLVARKVDVVLVADGCAHKDTVAQAFVPLGARAPRLVCADDAVLMRPGPSLTNDVATVKKLFAP